ncbi:MAG TPA: carboxypeptidase-like regulatory domain-containing protein [Methylomirabilota bacterium]|nr:carboxypeptidase-like regulatory domain-containing protein [Methylomirabilota bacterium]
MKKTGLSILVFSLLFVFFIGARKASAQTATSGTVIGTVTDPSGAAIQDATVTLRNKGTNTPVTQNSNAAGQYTFVNVVPGEYDITVKKDGFRTANVPSLTVDVAKSYNVDVRLELGAASESVTVTTEARVELQTTDAQVGDVIGGTTLSRLPTLTRDAAELLTLQPGTTPYDTPANGGFGNFGGTVAGARSDQNAISLDGIDITDNTVGGGANAVNFIPTGVESLDEFKVGVTNSNESFGRSSGGEITLISKGGTNNFHGDGYWFHQSDGYNANSWDLNHTPSSPTTSFTSKAPFKDNREGVSVGGPIFHDKTFFFGNYERRRFPSSSQVSHIVPTDSLRNGILSFADATGTVQQYDLATATDCGPNGNLACDPRGIGISPTIKALYALNPDGNVASLPAASVDGNNTTGFLTNASTPIIYDFVTFRLDHNFSQKAHFFGKYLYSRNLQVTPTQIEALRGKPTIATSGNQLRGDGVIGALSYAFNTTTSNVIRYGWIRNRNPLPGLSPSASATLLEPQLPGTNTSAGDIALAPGLAAVGLIDVPIDVDTQRARTQGNFQRNKQLVDDFSKIIGKHSLTLGGDLRFLPLIAQRNDKVVGSLASLVATMDADVFGTSQVGSPLNRPPDCSATVTTFCLLTADKQRWDRLYAATLGIVDNVNVLAVRNGQLQAQPFGTPLIANTNSRAYNVYFQDTWRMRPTLTFTYGIGYGWQTPPTEANGQQTFMTDASTGKILTAAGYIQAKEQAALAGQIFNPTIAYVPIRSSGRSSIWNTDFGDVAPRVSLAWSPSYSDGIRGHMFGSGKTVVRAGFGIYYDRINNVQSVEIPQLGVGFAQTLAITTPACDFNGASAAGAGCNSAAGAGNIGASGFRVGVDGAIPVPQVPTVSSPIVPGPGGEFLSFAVDPSFKVGRSYSIDFTVQRELPGNMLMEIGYVGRLARDLPNSVDFDSSPYMFTDATSKQTFAQAYDAIQKQLAAGSTTVTAQPWFENQLPGLNANATAGCGNAAISTTQCFVNQAAAVFGSQSVGSLFSVIDGDRQALNLPVFNNQQVVFTLFMRTHNDLSNYHAAVFTLRKRPSHGLQFDLNYTFSKSLDQVGTVQNNAGTYASSFTKGYQYGPSLFDRTHVFNAIFNYDLPAGGSHKFHFGNSIADKVIAGWYTSGVFRATSGPPLTVVGGDLGGGLFANGLNEIPTVGIGSLGAGLHGSVCGSAGPGGQQFGTAGDGPNCGASNTGTGLNLFANPGAVASEFRAVNISTDGRDGTGTPIRGLGMWNLDMRLGKTTSFHERYKVEISADFFNIFNHVNFFQPSMNISNPANFGVITSELIPADRTQGSRWIQLGLRVSF